MDRLLSGDAGKYPRLNLRLANITFHHRLVLQGPARMAELISLRPAHTGKDIVLYLPQDRILLFSDLLFIGYHPYLADGDPACALHTLEQAAQITRMLLLCG